MEHHPDNVFSSMETIMTLVLEESEDIAPELLTPILASVKKDNEEVLPVARKLAERVLESCATKVKPYLIQAVNTLGISFDDYSEVVASICQETPGTVEQNEVHAISKDMADESNSVKASVDERGPEDKGKSTAVVSSEQVDPAIQQSPKSVMSNGVAQTGEDETLQLLNSENKQEHSHLSDQSKSISTSSNARPNNLETEKLSEPKSNSKDVSSSPPADPSVESAGSLKTEKEADIKISSPKALDNESGNVAALSPRVSLPDESHSKKAGGRPKKKESSIKEATPSSHDILKKVSEGTGNLEPKSSRRSGKKVPSEISSENKTPTVVDASSKEISDPEAKPLRQPAKKVDGSIKIDGSSSQQPEDKKKRGRGKAISEKDETKSSTKADDKEMVSSPKSVTKSTKDDSVLEETPKTNPKRKRTPGKEKESDYGENLVGSKIKVWWPDDQAFYEGVIDSFDPKEKKHKVLYTDGDEEVLYLKKEKWEFVGGCVSDGEQAADQRSPDASSDMPLKKKAKIISDDRTKQGKMDALPKKGGGASSSKSKGTSSKSGRKSREGSKVDGKSKDVFTKTASKSEDVSSGEFKDHMPRAGSSKSVDAAPKSAGKSKKNNPVTLKTGKLKDDNTSTPRTSTKSKQGTAKTGKSKQDMPKSASVSKGKNPKSSGKSSANGSGKVKYGGSSTTKERENMKDNSTDSAKGKSPTSPKAQGSDSKTGKKRRRGMAS
ncbi:nucleolar and coiled-body phosphoprotein 1 isoform X2 [Juglans microcarpa x Juglans regia]|uniref:nucleolar and coiled-body phosphoprotein 1 isoform X2 n=1 Tax=Juglans microcarpa x Juglans regia TaxID=2249226 RepID=UPI001B7EB7AB|nr:nucleolar and coiled-body phosphoprotein 1 isoform X2 [Juglans microcarpa x Juglans regia]